MTDSLVRALAVYIAAPILTGALLLGLYFSGVPWMQEVAAPTFNREFGLIETLQHVLLAWTAWIAFRAGGAVSARVDRVMWRFAAAGVLFIFLEEVDYGAHVAYELGWAEPDPGTPVNVHNRPGVLKPMKAVGNVLMVAVFVIAPWCVRALPPAVARWIPSAWVAGPFLVGVAVSQAADALNGAGFPHNGALRNNLSEFRETFVYGATALAADALRRRLRLPVFSANRALGAKAADLRRV